MKIKKVSPETLKHYRFTYRKLTRFIFSLKQKIKYNQTFENDELLRWIYQKEKLSVIRGELGLVLMQFDERYKRVK